MALQSPLPVLPRPSSFPPADLTSHLAVMARQPFLPLPTCKYTMSTSGGKSTSGTAKKGVRTEGQSSARSSAVVGVRRAQNFFVDISTRLALSAAFSQSRTHLPRWTCQAWSAQDQLQDAHRRRRAE